MKTAKQIVSDCNDLARTFCEMQGYQAPEGRKFYEKANSREEGFWNLATAAYDHIEGTDVDACLDELLEDDNG